MPRHASLVLAAAVLAVSGCGGPDVEDAEFVRAVDDAARTARAEVDALADQVGSGAEPVRDELVECDRSGDEGRRVAYTVRVEVGDAARAVAGNPLRDRYESRGWAVAYRGETTVLFQRAGTRLVLILDPDTSTASVGSTGGCVV